MYQEMFINFIARFLKLSYSMIMENSCKLHLKLMVRYLAFKEIEVCCIGLLWFILPVFIYKFPERKNKRGWCLCSFFQYLLG